MYNKKDGVTITWNYKQYYFDGLLGNYITFCSLGVLSGGMIGAAIGSVFGGAICVASPVIICVAAVKLLKQFKLK